jgi:hypothetical protein
VPEECADRADGWLTESMEGVGDSVVNRDRAPEDRGPIMADIQVYRNWTDKK